MLGATLVVGILWLLSIGLSIVEYRKIAPLSFRCVRCGTEFRQAAYRDFPRICPACHSRQWAL